MQRGETDGRRRIPATDKVMRSAAGLVAQARFGHAATLEAVRHELQVLRLAGDAVDAAVIDRAAAAADAVAAAALARLEAEDAPRLRAVFNLTGTVLHTNLGRALVAESAVEAAAAAMRNAVALEYDLGEGRRGERDNVLRDLLRALTGADDATAVNNNAAAVLLALNTLARGRPAIVSRGELIEIGGAFRMPDIMSRAGTRLVEVGTTNRTRLSDYADAIRSKTGAKTGMILKVHPSNYRIEGFTAGVSGHELAALARQHGVPLVHDLGSGTLVDLARFGLPREPTVAQAVADGADLVTFSGDKLLGGPQAGFIVGRADLIRRINLNPMKRAMRLDKGRLAALEATLKLYRDPDRLPERLPTLRMLTRPQADIILQARRLMTVLIEKLAGRFSVEQVTCRSEIGSGALPRETMPSAGLAIRTATKRHAGRRLAALAAALRSLRMPVLGRIEDDALVLDLRCLEDEAAFATNLLGLDLSEIKE